MRRAGAWGLLLLAALAGPPPVAAQRGTALPDAQVRVVGRVTVVARPSEIQLGMALAEQADGALTWPGLGRRQLPEFSLIVVRGEDDFARASRGRAPAWGGAVTVPAARTILLRADAGTPLKLFRHELAHLALHEAIRSRVPRWFDEGFATWAAGEFDRLDAIDLHVAVAAGTSLDFASITRELASPVGDPARAYSLAATAVLMLARAHPSGTLEPLLQQLAEGVPFDVAVLRTTGRSLDRFEEAWAKDVRHRYGVIAWTLGLLPWIVVFVLAFVGAALRRRRDAPRRAALDVGWTMPADDGADGEELPEEAPTAVGPFVPPNRGTTDPA